MIDEVLNKKIFVFVETVCFLEKIVLKCNKIIISDFFINKLAWIFWVFFELLEKVMVFIGIVLKID